MPSPKNNAAINAALMEADRLLSKGEQAQAVKAFEKVLKSDPANVSAAYNIGIIHHRRGELEPAERYFSRALAAAPRDADTMVALALVQIDKGDTHGALTLAARACDVSPSARIMTKAGVIRREAGDLDGARQLFAKALRQDPLYVTAYFSLATLHKFQPDDGIFPLLLTLADKAKAKPLPPQEQIKLEFTLGKAHLDCGDADKAFAHYAAGNRLKRASFKVFTIEKFEAYADSITKLFTPELAAKLKDAGDPTTRPVFIVGMPRSGSTLTDQIISSHPLAASLGESDVLQQSIPAYNNAEVKDFFTANVPSITAELLSNLTPATLKGIAKKYLSLTAPKAQSEERLVDKMLFNYLWVGVIRLAFPNAKIIHCTRDPMDMGLSIWQLSFQGNMPWAYDLSEIGRYYKAYRKIMAHWDKIFPATIFEANYETMVDNQESETRRLLEFCGLPFDARCLNFHESDRKVSTASAAQVRKPIYKGSVKKWQKFEKYLGPLLAEIEKPA